MGDFADGYVLGTLFGGGGAGGNLRAIIDDNAGNLIIFSGNSGKNEINSQYNFTYETETFSSNIETTTTSGDTTVTHTETFSAAIITKLYNSSGTLILSAECNSKGEVTGYFDKNNSEIFLLDFTGNITDENIGISGADPPAIAWVMAANTERNKSVAEQKKKYRKGVKNGSDNGGEPVTEPWDTTDGNLDIPFDNDGTNTDPDTTVTEPAVIDMTKGIAMLYGDPETGETQSTLRLWLDPDYVTSAGSTVYYGRIMATVTSADGTSVTKELSDSYIRSESPQRTEAITNIYIINGRYYPYVNIKRIINDESGTWYQTTTDISLPTVSGTYLGTTNNF